MTQLAISNSLLPASEETLARIRVAEQFLGEMPQVDLPVEHTLHAGMYLRTVRTPANIIMVGALVKVAQALIVSGDCLVYGEKTLRVRGYNVLTGSPGRKQLVRTLAPTAFTAVFPTGATTVAEAEQEFTDEASRLQTRKELELCPE